MRTHIHHLPQYPGLQDDAAEYADTLADMDEALIQWRDATMQAEAHHSRAVHQRRKEADARLAATQALESLTADQRQLLTEAGAVEIGGMLHLVSVDADGRLALRSCSPLRIGG